MPDKNHQWISRRLLPIPLCYCLRAAVSEVTDPIFPPGWVKYERNERRCFSNNQASKLLGIVNDRLDLQYPTILLP
jgi:hypothetical protein